MTASSQLLGRAILVAALLIAGGSKAVSTDQPGGPDGETPVSGGGSNCLEIKVVSQGGLTPVWVKCSAPSILGMTWTWSCLQSELNEPTLHGCQPGYSFRECVDNTV